MLSTSRKIGNVVIVVTGFLAFAAAAVMLWTGQGRRGHLYLMVGMYVPTALGVTVGFHRLLAHRAFATFPLVRYILAGLGSLAVQGPVIEWVSDHRKHHAYSDREGDPHSPHVGYDGGLVAAVRGLWHAHLGWVLRTQGGADEQFYSRDLLEDRPIRLMDRYFGVFVFLSFALPGWIGYATMGGWSGALGGMFWGGLARIALMHHVTFSVNSLCHYFGARPYPLRDHSGNVAILALPTMGESWHHNHHAFPSSAFHGLRWWEIDISGLVIRMLRATGLAWNVRGVTPEAEHRMASRARSAAIDPGDTIDG